MEIDWKGAIERARAHSPFLSLAMKRLPDIASLVGSGQPEDAFCAVRELGRNEDVTSALRLERLGLSLALGIGDLAGAFPVGVVMRDLSAFADRALDRAIREAIARRTDEDSASGFCALALGKLGACELNYSSDIDPILLYDPETLPRRERDEPGQAALRYARTIVELLSHKTADGFVFRVDLRLRPASEITPLAISFDAALSHYESSAIAWERAAFIRARSAAGDVQAGERFLSQIRSFVWRRSLDFTTIEEIRRLTARIRNSYDGPAKPGPGFDLKRGRGGIREIEFFAQTHQLIYGGRLPNLRQRGTRAALDALAAEQIIAREEAEVLGRAYDRLRVIEHRLQMVDDRQTHELPDAGAPLDNVAQLDGLADGAALIAELEAVCGRVAELYDELLDRGRGQGADRGEATAVLAELAARAEEWKRTMKALKGNEAQLAFDAILPDLAGALAEAPDPDRAITRLQTLLANLPTAINLFRLLEQRPGLLEQILRVLTLASPLADELSRRPELLDALIDSTALDLPGPADELVSQMRGSESEDYESRLDHVRQVVGEQRFALGVQLTEGRHDPLDIAEGLCRVAEAALKVSAEAATREFVAKHGVIEGAELLVLGLGRLGGGALTHASDLDIVYLFTGEIGVESDGPRPLTASLYFNRLAQRVTAALSVPTAEGALYEVDTRLRPQGAQGPLAVSVESFARYQQESAWTWEHMALARARPLYGSPAARKQLENTIRQVLSSPRDPEQLKADVLAMREEMAMHKPPRGPLDAKLLRGGLVDCEFCVHHLQLREGIALVPPLEKAIAELAEAGLLSADFGEHHAVLTRLLVAARLLGPDGNIPPPAAASALARACGQSDLGSLLQALARARQGIAKQWTEQFGEKLEIQS